MKLRALILILALAGSFAATPARPQEKPDEKPAPAKAAGGIQGIWDLKAKQGSSTVDFIMELRQEGGTLTGKITGPEGRSMPLSNVSFDGGVLKFSVPGGGGNIQAEGAPEFEKLAGTYDEPVGHEATWEANPRL